MDVYNTYSSREVDQVVCSLWDTKEILMDQGTNLNSQLLQKLYKLLGVKAINTSLHHLQTDGLVECFNQTLKSMLKRRFLPFELIYSKNAKGSLNVCSRRVGVLMRRR